MARSASFALAFLLALQAAPRTSAQGPVHVVDWLGGPGSRFLEIADAVAAAADGAPSALLVLDQAL
jgi:hypothetical protein